MAYVIGNVVYIMTKHLSINIMEKTSWNSCIELTENSMSQINFWKNNFSLINGKQFTSDLSIQKDCL